MELQDILGQTLKLMIIFLLLLVVLALKNLASFKIQQRRVREGKWRTAIPPTLPYTLPLLKSTILFLFNGMELLAKGS